MATIRLLHGIYASAPFRFHFPNKLSASHGHIGSQVTESVIRQRAGVNPMHIGQISIVIKMSVYKILQLVIQSILLTCFVARFLAYHRPDQHENSSHQLESLEGREG